MSPRRITHQNIFRVLLAGFGLVIALLLAAALVSVRSIDSIQQNAASLVREQSVTNRLIDELHSQQTSLSEVFSILARDPDSVDYDRIMSQLAEADRDIDRISTEGAQTPERELWARLRQTSADFSREARRILSVENPETFRSLDLFRDHEAFIAIVARLIEAEYRKVSDAQQQIDRQSTRLLDDSFLFAAASVLLALVFAGVTVRMVLQLIREMDWQTAELGRVSWHMLEDQEATARRFSHELHDELGQSLTAVKTNLAALESQAPRAAAGSPIVYAWWTTPSATSARCRSSCAPPSWTISVSRPACAGWPKAFRPAPESKWISTPTTPAACPMRPRPTCSALPRRRSPTWRATPRRSTCACAWSRTTARSP